MTGDASMAFGEVAEARSRHVVRSKQSLIVPRGNLKERPFGQKIELRLKVGQCEVPTQRLHDMTSASALL
jgi:hypothetical protein